MNMFRQLLSLLIVCTIYANKDNVENNYLRRVKNIRFEGSWKSFPTPGPKTTKQNPNAKCALQTFGRCNSGDYCKSISYDKYQCTKCPKDKKCTGDGKMGPPRFNKQ
jgi:hypothetical protein